MGLPEFYSTLFSALFLYFCKTKNNHVLPPSHPSHHLPTPRRYRPRLRLDVHRVSAHPHRLGAGRHRRADYSQQEQVNMSRVKIITVDKRTRTQQQLKNRSPIKVINGNNISKKPIKMRMKRLHNISSILNSKQSASIKR